MDALLSANGLYRYYGDYCALNNIAFELCIGEVLGLLGPNGAGKSTSLRILSGCLAPSKGSVTINGIDLRKAPLQAKQRLGYLPEIPPLYPELKVDEYLRFCARLRGVSGTGLEQALARAKRRTGLTSAGKRLIAHLSKGYRQRVGIAQAIIHDPEFIILDEPTSGLDPNQLVEIRTLIQELGEDHGVILSTHILPEVQAVCSRVMIIHEGELVYSDRLGGTPSGEDTLFWVELSRPPKPAVIENLTGVEEVLEQAGNRFRLRTEAGCDPEALVERIVNRGWGLREISPIRQSLEQIFSHLTTGEAFP